MKDFYVVTENGYLSKYHKVGSTPEGTPKWAEETLMDCTQFDEWKIKKVSFDNYLGVCSFSEDYAKTIKGFYSAKDFYKAKKYSKELWNKVCAPLSKWRVCKYFDDHFECYVSGALSKKNAYDLKIKLSKSSSPYSCFEIQKVN